MRPLSLSCVLSVSSQTGRPAALRERRRILSIPIVWDGRRISLGNPVGSALPKNLTSLRLAFLSRCWGFVGLCTAAREATVNVLLLTRSSKQFTLMAHGRPPSLPLNWNIAIVSEILISISKGTVASLPHLCRRTLMRCVVHCCASQF